MLSGLIDGDTVLDGILLEIGEFEGDLKISLFVEDRWNISLQLEGVFVVVRAKELGEKEVGG